MAANHQGTFLFLFSPCLCFHNSISPPRRDWKQAPPTPLHYFVLFSLIRNPHNLCEGNNWKASCYISSLSQLTKHYFLWGFVLAFFCSAFSSPAPQGGSLWGKTLQKREQMSLGLILKDKSKTTMRKQAVKEADWLNCFVFLGTLSNLLLPLMPLLFYWSAISTSRGYELSRDLSTGFTLQGAAVIYRPVMHFLNWLVNLFIY